MPRRLLADESVDLAIVEALRAAGHDVTYVAEVLPGAPDGEVLAIAARQRRLLVTADKDFGELVFRRRQISAGVLLLRLAGATISEKQDIVTTCVGRHGSELSNRFSVQTVSTLRIRHSP